MGTSCVFTAFVNNFVNCKIIRIFAAKIAKIWQRQRQHISVVRVDVRNQSGSDVVRHAVSGERV